MQTLSAVVVAKNEENNIADCLDSVGFCDEIIVVDDSSTDRTADIAKRYTSNIYNHKSVGYVEAVRKFAIQKATKDWVLNIDADERVTKELACEIQEVLKESSEDVCVYRIPRKNFYLGNNPWPTTEFVEKLFRRDVIKKYDWQIHGSPVLNGKTANLENELLHFTHVNLESMLNKTIQWSKVEAQMRYDAGHPLVVWWRFPRVMMTGFYEWYIKQKGYKAGIVGLIEGIYQSFSMFVTYARLWELQQKKDKNAI